ncbi:MAG: hypothetical protein E6H85_07625 [Chloroflexi bacterium]|nr:MAG: hypothetical protein E6H85_07625 [Chloroflexota bacterium]
MRPPPEYWIGLFIWWLAIAVLGSLIAVALVEVAYSRVVYLFVVMPIAGVLLFPMAYADAIKNAAQGCHLVT